jgi:Ca2+-binding EF-hand superfamily protein
LPTRDTGCIGEEGIEEGIGWSKYSWAQFDAWVERELRGRGVDPFPRGVNTCRKGSEGLVCANCVSDELGRQYEKVEGTCVSCSSFPFGGALVTFAMYLAMCLFFVHKSRRIETGVDCDTHISSSIIGILVFFMQTATLLPRDTLELGLPNMVGSMAGTTFKYLMTLLTFWPDSPDDDSDRCFSSGNFVVDYFAKYLVPVFTLLMTWVLSKKVVRLKKRQVRMAMLFSVQFGLFPVIMRSVSLFFCRDDLREFYKAGKPPAPVIFGSPSMQSLWSSGGEEPRAENMPAECRNPPTELSEDSVCHLDWSSNRLRLDPEQVCSGAGYYVSTFFAGLIFAFCAIGFPIQLYRILDTKMKQHEKLLRISMYMKYGIERGKTMIVNDPSWKSSHSPEFAALDAFSFLYYPLRRERYWWAIVWIFRPALIAIVYSARDRHTLVTFGIADWRVWAVVILMIYNTIQATVRPFKHLNESQLDATSVLLLMLLFVMSINLDMMRYNVGSDDETLVRLVAWFAMAILFLVVAASVHSKRRTDKSIRRKIARQHWKLAWTNMSAESDPFAQILDDDTTSSDSLIGTKHGKALRKVSNIGVRTRLPIFEQIDVDGSEEISVQEFLHWWHLRTLRRAKDQADNSDSIGKLAEELFHQHDADKSGLVSRVEFEGILAELRTKHEADQDAIKRRQPLEERQAALQQEKDRVLAHIDHFPRFTVTQALSEPDEEGKQLEYHRVDMRPPTPKTPKAPEGSPSETTPGAAEVEQANPLHQAGASFEVEVGKDSSSSVDNDGVPIITLPARRRNKTQQPTSSAGGAATDSSTSATTEGGSTPTVQEIFDEVDADGSGEISIDEVSSWWTKHGGDERLLPKLEEAFGIVEYRDGVAGVSLSEFEEVVLVVAMDDWELAKDPATGRQYYVNRITRESSWKEPNKACVGAFLAAAGISRTQASVQLGLEQRRHTRRRQRPLPVAAAVEVAAGTGGAGGAGAAQPPPLITPPRRNRARSAALMVASNQAIAMPPRKSPGANRSSGAQQQQASGDDHSVPATPPGGSLAKSPRKDKDLAAVSSPTTLQEAKAKRRAAKQASQNTIATPPRTARQQQRSSSGERGGAEAARSSAAGLALGVFGKQTTSTTGGASGGKAPPAAAQQCVPASALAESSLVSSILSAVRSAGDASGGSDGGIQAEAFSAFLDSSKSQQLVLMDTLALKRHFKQSFASSAQAGRLSVEELRQSLGELVSSEYIQGLDPKSGRPYYVDKKTRATAWVIDAHAVDACLGRFFDL